MAYFLADSTRLMLAGLICLFMTVCALQTVMLMVCALERRRPAIVSTASMLCQSSGILVALFGFGLMDPDVSLVALPLIALRIMTTPKDQPALARAVEVPILICGLAGMALLLLHRGLLSL